MPAPDAARNASGQFGRPTGLPGWLAGKLMAAWQGNRARNSWTIDLLDVQPADRVLEIGYGPGLGIEAAARKATRGLVVGFDHSCVMHGQARARNQRAVNLGGVLLRTGGLEDAPALGLIFDKAFSCNVAQFWPDPDAALATLRRLLRPGGVLATTFQPSGLKARAEDADRFAELCRERLERAEYGEIRLERLPALKPTPAVCLLARA